MDLPNILEITARVSRVLTELRIPHLVGDSVASILYGQLRTTLDTDLAADLQSHHVQPLTAALSHDFYIEPERVADAIRRRASFNVIHHRTNIKVYLKEWAAHAGVEELLKEAYEDAGIDPARA